MQRKLYVCLAVMTPAARLHPARPPPQRHACVSEERSGTHARTSGGQPTAIPSYQTSATAGRITGPGTIALQTHDAKSAVLYKNIRIRPLD